MINELKTDTWELIVVAEKPILVANFDTVVTEGDRLQFPLHRAYEMNLLNNNWNSFIVDMAGKMQKQLLEAIESGDSVAFSRCIKHTAGISSMYRLNGAEFDGEHLILDMAMTDFKDYIGTTAHALLDSDFRKLLIAAGEEDAGDQNRYFANPLATNTNIVTSDGLVPVGMRSDKVAVYPDVPHVVGGYVKVNGANSQGFSVQDVDLFGFMAKELAEEMGVSQSDMVKQEFFGICRNTVTRGPEAMYNVVLNLTAEQLHESWRTKSRDKFEHRNIEFYTREELGGLLDSYRGKMVPSGEATLTLFLEHYG